MYAILIHFIGFIVIDRVMPEWVAEAGLLVLSAWYGSFVAIDMIAILFCKSRGLLYVLAASCSWSALLTFDVSMGSDFFQQHDFWAQCALDACFAISVIAIAYSQWRARHAAQEW